MSDITGCVKRVEELLTCIDNNPTLFGALEEKKVTPALMAFQCITNDKLATSIDKLANTMNNMLKALNRKGGVFYQEGEGV